MATPECAPKRIRKPIPCSQSSCRFAIIRSGCRQNCRQFPLSVVRRIYQHFSVLVQKNGVLRSIRNVAPRSSGDKDA